MNVCLDCFTINTGRVFCSRCGFNLTNDVIHRMRFGASYTGRVEKAKQIAAIDKGGNLVRFA